MLSFSIWYLGLIDAAGKEGNFMVKFNNLCECKLIPITTTTSVQTMTTHGANQKDMY
jgi:hypothetical protein